MAESLVKKEADKLARLAEVTMDRGGVALGNLRDALEFCDIVVSSGLAPADMKSRAQIFVAVQYGAELGLSPMQSLQSVYVVKGRPSLSYKAALGLCRRAGLKPEVGNSGKPYEDTYCGFFRLDGHEVTFTVAQAKKAGIWGVNVWKTYPDDMLVARAVSRGINRYASHALMGCEVAEAAQDFEGRRQRATIVEAAPVEPEPDEAVEALLMDEGDTLRQVEREERETLDFGDDGSVPPEAEGYDQ